eukprot:1771713-Amphidinium_carterae.1
MSPSLNPRKQSMCNLSAGVANFMLPVGNPLEMLNRSSQSPLVCSTPNVCTLRRNLPIIISARVPRGLAALASLQPREEGTRGPAAPQLAARFKVSELPGKSQEAFDGCPLNAL